MIVAIKTTKESTVRELLKLLEAIRYQNLYAHIEDLETISKVLPKTKVSWSKEKGAKI